MNKDLLCRIFIDGQNADFLIVFPNYLSFRKIWNSFWTLTYCY